MARYLAIAIHLKASAESWFYSCFFAICIDKSITVKQTFVLS